MSGKYYFVFIVLSFLVSVSISLGFVGTKVDESVIDMMDDHSKTISNLAVSHLSQHISNRVKIANDIAQQPIVVGGVMGSSASASYLNDYMSELSVLGVKEEFIVLDILGDEIFSSFSGSGSVLVGMTSWFEALIDNEAQFAVFLLDSEDRSQLAVAVSTRYNGLAEGVLVILFSEPFDEFIESLISNEEFFGIELFGPYMDYKSFDNVGNFELVNRKTIDLTGLTLDYRVNETALAQNKWDILFSIALSVFTGLAISFGILWPLGRHYLLEPYRQLETSEAKTKAALKELKQTQSELAASHERSRLATNAAQIGIWEWDIEANELSWDEWMYRLYGLSKESVNDAFEAWNKTIHPEDMENLRTLFIRVLKHDETSESEFRIVKPDGDVRVLQVKWQVSRDASGWATRVIGVNYDVTDRVNSTKLLEKARIEAEQGAMAKGEFLANMSHEIRTPMNGVIGMLQLVSNTELTSDQSEKIHIALSSAQSLLTLLNDILDFSKIEAGKLDIEDTSFDLDSVLQHTIKSLDHTIADGRDVHIFIESSAAPTSSVRGDPGRIRQIVTNLLGNAIKFTKQGEIKVRSELIDNGESGWRLRCSITDTGIGIPEEKLDILFEEFSQVDASTTRKYGGTGLGLSITKRLCELMGGSINVTSELGRGSCFSFEIKLGKVTDMEQKDPENHDSYPSLTLDNEYQDTNGPSDLTDSNNKVLLVEDNKVNQLVATALLSNLGLSVDNAENGAKALEILDQDDESTTYTLILMDCQMPEMDGYEATRCLRSGAAGSYYQNIPIIAMTANAMEGDRERCLAAGMDDYISKPIDQKTLQDTLSKWLYFIKKEV